MRYTSLPFGALPRVAPTVAFAALSALLCLFLVPAQALDFPLKIFKNNLFSDQPILDVSDDGALIVIDYNKQRDLYGRDLVPESECGGTTFPCV